LCQRHGFSLHANVSVPAHRRDQLERLIRYTARGAVSLERLEPDANGDLLYTFTRPWSDGTMGIKLSRLELLEKLAASAAPRWGWARLLKRVFTFDMERCPACGRGTLRIIAAITHADVIRKILRHLKLAAEPPPSRRRSRRRGPAKTASRGSRPNQCLFPRSLGAGRG
jgi:hypothetical protein